MGGLLILLLGFWILGRVMSTPAQRAEARTWAQPYGKAAFAVALLLVAAMIAAGQAPP